KAEALARRANIRSRSPLAEAAQERQLAYGFLVLGALAEKFDDERGHDANEYSEKTGHGHVKQQAPGGGLLRHLRRIDKARHGDGRFRLKARRFVLLPKRLVQLALHPHFSLQPLQFEGQHWCVVEPELRALRLVRRALFQ